MTRQWLRLDAMFFSSPLAGRLQDEFGWAGPVVYLAFLGACKRGTPAGQMSFVSDNDALAQMGLSGRKLIDDTGQEWSMDAFWTLLGRMKNVRRTSRGRVANVRCTHWERWQDDERREDEAERQRRSRAKKKRDMGVTHVTEAYEKCHVRDENENETKRTPPKPPPAGGAEVAPLPTDNGPTADRNGRPDGVNLRDAVEALKAERGWTPTGSDEPAP